jgi:DNA-binding CsgD family transcriptional regulator
VNVSRVGDLAEIISSLYRSTDRSSLQQNVLEGIRQFGFYNFCMSINIKEKRNLLVPQLTSIDPIFFQDFDRYGFVDIDPVLSSSMAMEGVYAWTSRREAQTDAQRKLVSYLRSFPAAQGVVIPLPHMPGRVSTVNCWANDGLQYDKETMRCVTIIARVAMMKAESLGLCIDDAQARLVDADLSVRQVEVLSWAAQGKSNADIGVITGQSCRAVDYHMREILRKLKVSSRAQAVALASGSRLDTVARK